MTYPFTLYHRPDGHKTYHDIANIEPDIETWYRENDIIIGIEEIMPNVIAIYAQYWVQEDGEPLEITYIVPTGETCQTALTNIKNKIIILKKELTNE